jgi:hypothetical protein
MPTTESKSDPSQNARKKQAWQMAFIIAFFLVMLLLSWFIWLLAGRPESVKNTSTESATAISSTQTPFSVSGFTETPVVSSTATQDVFPTVGDTVVVPNRPWVPVSSSYFRSETDLQNDWRNLTTLGFVFTLEPYLDQPALHLSFTNPIWVKISNKDGNWADTLQDMQLEANLAFESNQGKTILAVRYLDENNYYGLVLNQKQWQLIKMVDGISTELANGKTTQTLANGNWGWYKIGCIGDQIFVWDENDEIASISDPSLPQGGAAMGFLPDTKSGKVYVYYYRLMARSSE